MNAVLAKTYVLLRSLKMNRCGGKSGKGEGEIEQKGMGERMRKAEDLSLI